MNRFPVAETVRFAYTFTFGQIGTIIGLIWIPAVINAVGQFAVNRIYGPDELAALSQGSHLPASFGLVLLYSIASLLVASIYIVAVTRQALGLRQGPALAHFALGTEEFRVFGGFLGLYLLSFLFSLGVTLVVVLVSQIVAGAAPNVPGLQAVPLVLALAGICAVVYALIRLSFLMVPSALVEGGFGIARSWQLTQGNFWNIFLVGLLTILPLAIFLVIVEAAIYGPEYFSSVAAMMRDQAHKATYMAEQVRITEAKLPLLVGLSFVITPITCGLVFAPAAFAYRALTGKEPADAQ